MTHLGSNKSLKSGMATTIMITSLELGVAENVDAGDTSISHAPSISESFAIPGNDLLTRRAQPFEAHGRIAGSEIVTLETALAASLPLELSLWRTALVIATLAGLAFANSMSIGLITIGLPVIAADLDLSESLLLW
jgi:hypothetical protein